MAKTIAVAEQGNTAMDQLKSGPARLGEFLKDVRSEMKKVVTPSREEVQSTTLVVIVTVFIFAAYFWIVDNIVGHLIDQVFKASGEREVTQVEQGSKHLEREREEGRSTWRMEISPRLRQLDR